VPPRAARAWALPLVGRPQVPPGGGRINECMKAHPPELSEPCKEAFLQAWLRQRERRLAPAARWWPGASDVGRRADVVQKA